jgi:hypothetical protein
MAQKTVDNGCLGWLGYLVQASGYNYIPVPASCLLIQRSAMRAAMGVPAATLLLTALPARQDTTCQFLELVAWVSIAL